MSRASDAALQAVDAGSAQDAVALARKATEAGDADAASLLAHWLLAGDVVPRDLPAARVLLRQAAAVGHEAAALSEIALTASGAGGVADWPGAVALLETAATRHGGKAAQQLGVLSRMAIDAVGNPLGLLEPESLSEAPAVQRWRGLFTPEECVLVATTARDLLAPSLVADPASGRMIAHPVRTSSAAVIGPTRESLPIQALLRRIAAATSTDHRQGEALTVLHYAPGQQYRPHMDALPGEGNQRIATVIVYLNQGYLGGETRFPATGLTIRGSGGDAICFANVLGSQPDPASRHESLPIRQGAKWAATRWIRARPFDPWQIGSRR